MMRRIVPVGLSALLLSTTALADSLELKLNDDMAELTYSTMSGAIADSDFNLGFLFNVESDLAATAGFQSSGRVDDYLSFAVGMKGYGLHVDEPFPGLESESVVAMALGGGIGYTIPNTPLTLAGTFYFAPAIITFGDADRVRDLNFRVQAQLLPNAAVFVGYRDFRVRLDVGEYRIDDAVHVGVKIGF